MPQAPNVDGLPLWLQVAVTILFGVATLLVAFKGWKSTETPKDNNEKPTVAHITDTYAIRNNTDQLRAMEGCLVSLQKAIEENTHYVRNKIDIEREVCQRLRELRDRLE